MKPAGPDGSFYQPYNLMTATIGAEQPESKLNGALPAARRSGFLPAAIQFHRQRHAPTSAFAGFGITSPERKYDDYPAAP